MEDTQPGMMTQLLACVEAAHENTEPSSSGNEQGSAPNKRHCSDNVAPEHDMAPQYSQGSSEKKQSSLEHFSASNYRQGSPFSRNDIFKMDDEQRKLVLEELERQKPRNLRNHLGDSIPLADALDLDEEQLCCAVILSLLPTDIATISQLAASHLPAITDVDNLQASQNERHSLQQPALTRLAYPEGI